MQAGQADECPTHAFLNNLQAGTDSSKIIKKIHNNISIAALDMNQNHQNEQPYLPKQMKHRPDSSTYHERVTAEKKRPSMTGKSHSG